MSGVDWTTMFAIGGAIMLRNLVYKAWRYKWGRVVILAFLAFGLVLVTWTWVTNS